MGFWGGRGYVMFFSKKIFFLFFFFEGGGGWKICNVSVMFLLLCVHVCVTRTGWKTKPQPKTVILPIKKSINQSINQSVSPAISLGFFFFFCLPSYISGVHHSSSAFLAISLGFFFFFFCVLSHISGVHHSSSAFLAISLGFIILLLPS